MQRGSVKQGSFEVEMSSLNLPRLMPFAPNFQTSWDLLKKKMLLRKADSSYRFSPAH